MLSLSLASVVFLLVLFFYPEKKLTQSDINRIENKKQELIQKTKEIYGFYYDLPLFIEPINKQIWGAMLYSGGRPKKIVINRDFYLENPDYVINSVMPHEWAHVVARLIYKKDIKGHGKEWLSICKSLSNGQCARYVQDEFVVEEKIRSSLRSFLGE